LETSFVQDAFLTHCLLIYASCWTGTFGNSWLNDMLRFFCILKKKLNFLSFKLIFKCFWFFWCDNIKNKF
jgi:hypothetical protein